MEDYKAKYLKYKRKYITLKKLIGSGINHEKSCVKNCKQQGICCVTKTKHEWNWETKECNKCSCIMKKQQT